MRHLGGFVLMSKAEYEAMKNALARCDEACPLLARLKEVEPKPTKPEPANPE